MTADGDHQVVHRQRTVARAACTECGRKPLSLVAAGVMAPTDQLACDRCGGMFDLATFTRPVVHLEYSYEGARRLACYDPDVDGLLEIGRGVDCAISLPEPTLGRRHCAVIGVGDSFRLDKMGSSNAIRLNDELIVRAGVSRDIGDGDKIGLWLFGDEWMWIDVSIVDG